MFPDEHSQDAKCPHCEKSFDRLYLLKEHWHSEHGEKTTRFSCPQCDVSFVLKAQLEKHMALHSPSSQSCKTCNKTFANVYRLQRHMISHEESTELRKFKCPECGKAFKFKHHLKEHIRIHSGEKPFECPNCGKRFSHSGSYSSHMTSKKCWVVNLKMRGGAGDGGSPQKPEGLVRPLVPKALENVNGLDVNMASMFNAGLFPQQFIPYDPSTAATQMMAQLNGSTAAAAAAFLPGHLPPFTTSHMISPMIPFTCPSLPVENHRELLEMMSGKFPAQLKGVMDGKSGLAHTMVSPGKDNNKVTVDENQNKELIQKEANGKVELCSSPAKAITTPMLGAQSKVVPDVPSTANPGSPHQRSTNMEKIQKVLDIVGAAGSQEQHQSKDGHSIVEASAITKAAGSRSASPEKNLEEESSSLTLTALATAATEQLQQLIKSESTQDKEKGKELEKRFNAKSSELVCRFCQQQFASPIDLHQHERYLCRQNKAIQLDRDSTRSNGATTPSSICTDKTEEDGMVDMDHSPDSDRKIRVRSMISEEQVQVLKAFYQTNPRPNKFHLDRLAQTVGFPKRVVQVWFQNMRARDRRKGRPLPSVGSSQSLTSPGAPISTPQLKLSPGHGPSITPPAYIPRVPQVAMPTSLLKPQVLEAPMTSSSPQVSPQNLTVPRSGDQPLDLTVRRPEVERKNQQQQPVSADLTPATAEGEVLNLSLKATEQQSPSSEAASANGRSSAPPAGLENSAIFKYMQQEGLFSSLNSARSKSLSPRHYLPAVASTAEQPMAALTINTIPAHSSSYPAALALSGGLEGAGLIRPAHQALLTSTPKKGCSPAAGLPGSVPSPSLASSGLPSPPSSSFDSSFNSCHSLESATTSSEPGKHDLTDKPKRARKKSWRQVSQHVSIAAPPQPRLYSYSCDIYRLKGSQGHIGRNCHCLQPSCYNDCNLSGWHMLQLYIITCYLC